MAHGREDRSMPEYAVQALESVRGTKWMLGFTVEICKWHHADFILLVYGSVAPFFGVVDRVEDQSGSLQRLKILVYREHPCNFFRDNMSSFKQQHWSLFKFHHLTVPLRHYKAMFKLQWSPLLQQVLNPMLPSHAADAA